MSFTKITRRGLSTLIPPKIASPNAIGAAQDAARMERVVNFYAGLPRGPAPTVKATGLIGRYQARYFSGKNASAVPLIQAIGGLLVLGYSIEYYFHLHFNLIGNLQRSRKPLMIINLPKDKSFTSASFPGHGTFWVVDLTSRSTLTFATCSFPRTCDHRISVIYSGIVMAEQSSRDVVDQTLSGGEASPSPSDAPATPNHKTPTEGDVEKTKHIATISATKLPDQQPNNRTNNTRVAQTEWAGGDKDVGGSSSGHIKQGAGLVATRALELNGVTDGDDTASQGGSESDTTDGRHHARTGSVKKPTTFKPVSFSKFVLPKAPGVPVPPKTVEKVPSTSTTPLGTPQPSSRPRLVAKTTAGMRDSLSKNGASGAKPGGSGPDPNQVWNKNRPVQPIPPKHLTDEELKQQYGIHMTSRIQEDGGGTESKWADIDDDEDDWAPETIEWTDGTKVTLNPHTDHVPVPEVEHQDHKEILPEPTVAKDPVKITGPKPTTSVGPNPTVLRLGASAERQAKAASVSSRGTNDRLPSGSTSPAPPPAKSPWAALPPIERVSPVNSSLPPPPASLPHRLPNNFPHREDHNGTIPPQEIAADDFNRTWRETPSSAPPRELFNSRSGRYEPVADTRRPSWRHDQGPRPPALLQRPIHDEHGGHGGPAEPSAAFQTHRASNQEGGGWGHRRASSNISGGSGGFSRRMSFGRTDAPSRYDGRRGSQVNELALIGHESSPAQHHAVPSWHSQAAVSVESEASPVESQPAIAVVPDVQQEDPLILQERIMKEKRLEAKQRKLEQEAKEAAAKEERIRQKLAALGPAPEKPKRKDLTQSNKVHLSPSSSTTPLATISSPPKPPVPEPSGSPKQYGLMKVHHPDTVRKLVANERERATEKRAEKHSDRNSPRLRRISSPHRDISHLTSSVTSTSIFPSDLDLHTSTQNTSTHTSSSLNPPSSHNSSSLNTSSPNSLFNSSNPLASRIQSDLNSNLNIQPDLKTDHWKDLNTQSSYPTWVSGPNLSSTPPVGNLWKPLSNDRTLGNLGNGIFDQNIGRGFPSQSTHLPIESSTSHNMMPPTQFSGRRRGGSASARTATFRHGPGPIRPPPSQEDAALVSAWTNFANGGEQVERHAEQQRAQDKAKPAVEKAAPVPVNVQWGRLDANAGSALNCLDESVVEKSGPAAKAIPVTKSDNVIKQTPAAKHTATAADSHAYVAHPQPYMARPQSDTGLISSWAAFANGGEQVEHRAEQQHVLEKPNESMGTKKAVPSLKVQWNPLSPKAKGLLSRLDDNRAPIASASSARAPVDAILFTDTSVRPLVKVPTPRESRFFPQGKVEDKRTSIEVNFGFNSPPPPDELSSRANDVQPIVNFPTPKPVVKLPIKVAAKSARTFASVAAPTSIAAPSSTVAPSSVVVPSSGVRLPDSTANWQKKINKLLNKVVDIAPSTKEPLESKSAAASASVLFPRIENPICTGHLQQFFDQEELFEDREPGSQPGVRVPNIAPATAWEKPIWGDFVQPKPVNTQGTAALDVGSDENVIVVRIAGNAAKTFAKQEAAPPRKVTTLHHRKGRNPRARHPRTKKPAMQQEEAWSV
ncbi:hypothetical protein N7495_001579 [Penicillium taxi]|uniref:uncharacterized protein n=1 Tax=Penicillium taxi TaxID=168475 RepID=UPI0025458AB6|nr:uncharacterized protein N7495_001579 [Penicillium taxi]KAJ5908897.1 hypothetical protein N7495_001579 [Penicillium taxi]